MIKSVIINYATFTLEIAERKSNYKHLDLDQMNLLQLKFYQTFEYLFHIFTHILYNIA